MKLKYFPMITGVIALMLVLALSVLVIAGGATPNVVQQRSSENMQVLKPANNNNKVTQTVRVPDTVESTVEIK